MLISAKFPEYFDTRNNLWMEFWRQIDDIVEFSVNTKSYEHILVARFQMNIRSAILIGIRDKCVYNTDNRWVRFATLIFRSFLYTRTEDIIKRL